MASSLKVVLTGPGCGGKQGTLPPGLMQSEAFHGGRGDLLTSPSPVCSTFDPEMIGCTGSGPEAQTRH